MEEFCEYVLLSDGKMTQYANTEVRKKLRCDHYLFYDTAPNTCIERILTSQKTSAIRVFNPRFEPGISRMRSRIGNHYIGTVGVKHATPSPPPYQLKVTLHLHGVCVTLIHLAFTVVRPELTHYTNKLTGTRHTS